MGRDAYFKAAREAIRRTDLKELREAIEAVPPIVTGSDSSGRTLLVDACEVATGGLAIPKVSGTKEQYAVVDLLLDSGADPGAADVNGWAPLHVAAMTGSVDLAQRLLAKGAPRSGKLLGANGGSPLALALFYAKRDVAELLADPVVPDNLRHAAALGRPIDRFVDGPMPSRQAAEGVDFYRPLVVFPPWKRKNQRQELLDEALTWSARNDRIESMEALVKFGANVNANPYRGTALLWATYSDSVDAARWLLDHGADPNLRHDFGGAEHGKSAVALHLAAQYSCLKCLKLLLERGADRTIADAAYRATPLQWAEHHQAADSAALLRA